MHLEQIVSSRLTSNSLNRMSYPSSMMRQCIASAMGQASAPTPVVYILNGDMHMRQAMHGHLSAAGLTSVAFASAAEYEAANKPDVPACLVLDVDLPDMDDFDVRQDAANRDVPIVFVTHWRYLPSWVRALNVPAVNFLTSPLRGAELLNAVHLAIALHGEMRSQHTYMAQLRQRFSRLTPRERQVWGLVNAGLLNKQSAVELGISTVTLQLHRRRVMRKMAARSLADLVRMATKLDIAVPEYSWSARTGAPVLSIGPTNPFQIIQQNHRRIRSQTKSMTGFRSPKIESRGGHPGGLSQPDSNHSNPTHQPTNTSQKELL